MTGSGLERAAWEAVRRGDRSGTVITMPRATDVLVFPAAGPVARSRGTWDLHRRAVRAGLTVHPLVPLEVILWPPWTWRRVS